jgi:hypothetical protein
MAHPSRAGRLFIAWLVLALARPAPGSADPLASSPLSSASIRRAVASASASTPPTGAQTGRWDQVTALKPGDPLAVTSDGRPSLEGDFLAADADGLTLRLEDGTNARLLRSQVTEVRRAGRRGSVRNAIIGAGAGAFLGFVMGLNVALRDCGGDCRDERVLVGLSLVGTPVAGGLLGYYAFGRGRHVVYQRPAP